MQITSQGQAQKSTCRQRVQESLREDCSQRCCCGHSEVPTIPHPAGSQPWRLARTQGKCCVLSSRAHPPGHQEDGGKSTPPGTFFPTRWGKPGKAQAGPGRPLLHAVKPASWDRSSWRREEHKCEEADGKRWPRGSCPFVLGSSYTQMAPW